MFSSADLTFFAAVARAPSLAAAGRHLGITPSAVTQRLQDLERRAGVRLVHRTGRAITLTDDGELLAARGTDILDAFAELEEALHARRGRVTGRLRVVAPLGFGRAHVGPLAGAFAARHPALAVELQLSDRLGRIPSEGWDVAIHIGALHDSTLIAHPLAPNRRVLCAAPALVARLGAPDAPADLRRYPALVLRENDEDATLWRFGAGDGTAAVRVEPRLASNDGEVIRQWALAGAGIMVRSEWHVADDLRAGRLVELLPGHALPDADIVLLVPSRTGRSARTVAFVEFLRESFRPPPWRRPA